MCLHGNNPPGEDLLRAVSVLVGYPVHSTGPNSCSLTYLAQGDPEGNLLLRGSGCGDGVMQSAEILFIIQSATTLWIHFQSRGGYE